MDLTPLELLLLRHSVVTSIGQKNTVFICQECYHYVSSHDPDCLLVKLMGDRVKDREYIAEAWNEWSRLRNELRNKNG